MQTNKDNSPHSNLEDLKSELAKTLESREGAKPVHKPQSKMMALGMRMASEFVSAILVGALLGFGFDYWLKTSPFGLIVGIIIGFAAGVVNLIRAAKSVTPEVSSATAVPYDDEDE